MCVGVDVVDMTEFFRCPKITSPAHITRSSDPFHSLTHSLKCAPLSLAHSLTHLATGEGFAATAPAAATPDAPAAGAAAATL